MKKILVLLLLIFAALPIYAQDEAPAFVPADEAPLHAERAWTLIESAELTEVDGEPALHITGSLPDGCQRPLFYTIERQMGILFVDVYQETLPGDTACPMMLIMIDETIPVSELLVEDENGTVPIFLVVNALHFHIAGNQPEGDATPETADIVLTPLTRTGLEGVTDVTVEEFAFEEGGDGFVYVTIRGTIAIGCNAPVLARVMAYPEGENVYVLDVFRAIREPETCPLREAPESFEFSVKTPVEVGKPAEFRAGDVILTYQSAP